MDWQSLLSIGGFVFGVAGILGGASAYFYKSRAQATIDLQNDEIAALGRKAKGFEECQGKLEEMAKNIEFLKGMVTQAPQIKELTSAVHDLTNMLQADLVYRGVMSKAEVERAKKRGVTS